MFLQKSAVAKGTLLKERRGEERERKEAHPNLNPGPLEVRAANGRGATKSKTGEKSKKDPPPARGGDKTQAKRPQAARPGGARGGDTAD